MPVFLLGSPRETNQLLLKGDHIIQGPQLSMQTVTHSVQHLANSTQTHVEQEKIKSARNKAVMSSNRGVPKIHNRP